MENNTSGQANAKKLIQKIMLPSASIPGAFPPAAGAEGRYHRTRQTWPSALASASLYLRDAGPCIPRPRALVGSWDCSTRLFAYCVNCKLCKLGTVNWGQATNLHRSSTLPNVRHRRPASNQVPAHLYYPRSQVASSISSTIP